MKGIRLLAGLFLVAMLAGAGAQAGYVDSPDQNRCDTWWRDGNAPDGSKYDDNGNKTTKDDGDARSVNDPTRIEIVDESGHYVVRNDYGYVEVVGGANYARPLGGDARGGYVQGEVETPVDDADFHVSSFAGGSPAYAEKNACVNYGETRYVNAMQCPNPPQTGNTTRCPL